jgi:hypothetical protein
MAPLRSGRHVRPALDQPQRVPQPRRQRPANLLDRLRVARQVDDQACPLVPASARDSIQFGVCSREARRIASARPALPEPDHPAGAHYIRQTGPTPGQTPAQLPAKKLAELLTPGLTNCARAADDSAMGGVQAIIDGPIAQPPSKGGGAAIAPAGTVITPYTEAQTVLVLVAALAFIGALIHVGAAVDHWREYHPYTLVFSCLAAAQVCWALLILRGASRRVLALGCVLQLGIAGLWAVSRTVGVPLAPTAWTPEQIGIADLTETLGELTTVLAVLSVLLAERSNAVYLARRCMPSILLFVILISALFGTGAHAG